MGRRSRDRLPKLCASEDRNRFRGAPRYSDLVRALLEGVAKVSAANVGAGLPANNSLNRKAPFVGKAAPTSFDPTFSDTLLGRSYDPLQPAATLGSAGAMRPRQVSTQVPMASNAIGLAIQ